MTETKTEWYFIVNPRAGSGKTMSEWVPAEKRLDKYGIPYVTAYTDHKRHAISLAREAAAEGYRKIAAVGGDGSIHEVLCGIVRYCNETGTPTDEFYIGVVPIGSGNDWIKSLNVPHDTEKVIDLIKAERFGQMDVVEVRTADGKTSAMANIGGIGFDSHVCKRVNMQKEGGMRSKMIYLDGLLYTIRTLKSINVKVVVDGREIHHGPTFSIALGNGRYSGSGMRQVPLADNNDGILDIMIVPKVPIGTVLKQIPKLFNGKINESRDLITDKFKELAVVPLDNTSNDIVELDGEIVGRLPISISMTDRKINVLHG